jgi:hypothetical protein
MGSTKEKFEDAFKRAKAEQKRNKTIKQQKLKTRELEELRHIAKKTAIMRRASGGQKKRRRYYYA